MKSLTVVAFAALAGLPSFPSLPSFVRDSFHLPVAVERWLYNPRERTGQAIAAQKKGDADRATAQMDTALRLAENDPLVRYDDGTAHLLAGHERQAVPLLERAAKEAKPDFAPAAWYNLGNARLASRDAAGAVEAYKAALRADPGNADAKFNLEIALREREKQRSGLGSQRPSSKGRQQDQSNPSPSSGSGNPSGSQQPQNGDDPQQSQQKQAQGGTQNQTGSQSQGEGKQPLPRYRDQPDMSAREAASLLASVENLERQQRREEAARRARQTSAKGKDW
jgi:Ca-activated chloride channel family protein